jgi:hypothetical protein
MNNVNRAIITKFESSISIREAKLSEKGIKLNKHPKSKNIFIFSLPNDFEEGEYILNDDTDNTYELNFIKD